MACFLPFRPHCFADRRVFRSKRRSPHTNVKNHPLLYFNATSACSPYRTRLSTRHPRRPWATFKKHLAQGLSTSQHFRNIRLFNQALTCLDECPADFTFSTESHTLQGLATLLRCIVPGCPWEASFSSQRSKVSLFRALLLSSDRWRVSSPLSAPALSHQTHRPGIGASAAYSHLKSRPPSCYPGY